MTIFFTIIRDIILPIMILIVMGMIMQRIFHFDMKTLSKLLMYFFVPAIAFVKIYESDISMSLASTIIGFLLLQLTIIYLISLLVSRLLKLNEKFKSSFLNSTMLSNNGNIGLPLNDLVFRHDPFAMSIQVIIIVFEILISFTLGLYNAGAAKEGLKNSLFLFLKMPVLYAILAAWLLNLYHIALPHYVMSSLNTAANGMLPVALITIGAQVVSSSVRLQSGVVLFSNFTKLILGPMVALIIIMMIGLEGITAQVLFIASAMPTSRNSAALALEYGNEPEFAAQAVLSSTVLSAITITAVIYVSQLIF